MLYIYNSRYPDEYDKPHTVFQKYHFRYEYDNSDRRQGLPGLCNLPIPLLALGLPIMPCRLPNTIIPIRECSYIGYGKTFQWPRCNFDVAGITVATDVSDLQKMLGTAFVACTMSENEKKYPIVPNIDIYDGCDSVSATGCLKLHFDGHVEPIWLGDEKRKENVDVYLERLPARQKRRQ